MTITIEEIRADIEQGQCPCCQQGGIPREQMEPAYLEELDAAPGRVWPVPELPALCWGCRHLALTSEGAYGRRAREILRALAAREAQ
jgi:hypothetical protein